MNQSQAQRLSMMSEIIRPMFTSLPLPRGVDHDELLSGYLVALEGLIPSTLKSVVVQLVKGLWYEEVKFCPRPPELANMVRFEQRRLDAMNRPRLPPPTASAPAFRDLRIVQRIRAGELAREGFVLIGEGITHDAFNGLAKKRALPAGTTHLWAIDEIWAPSDVAHLANSTAIESRSTKRQETIEVGYAEAAE